MSEAEILSILYVDDQMILEVRGIDMLYNNLKFKRKIPDITYDKWLENKYHTNQKEYEHIFIQDTVNFVVIKPSISYKGVQRKFIELFDNIDENIKAENKKYRYLFGGTVLGSKHDEFEICSKSPIEIRIPEKVIENLISQKK